MSQGVKITFVMNLKPEIADHFNQQFVAGLPETRSFPGCRSVDVYKNGDDPNKIILIEEWDSREDYGKYIAWRNRDGMIDAMADLFTSPSSPEFWPIKIA